MAYELISVYRSPEDQTYVPIFARKLKDRDQERCIYMSDLEIEFPRAVGLRVEVQVGENMKWVPLRSVRQQDRDVVIFNADQLGCRFLASNTIIPTPLCFELTILFNFLFDFKISINLFRLKENAL